MSTVGFRSSIGTNGTIGTNRVNWHSISTPLVKCISLRGLRLFSLRFGLSTVGLRSSIGTNGTIGTNRVTWHSIGTPLVKCISLRGVRLFSLRFGFSTVEFRSSIGTNGTIGTNRVTWHSIGTPLVKCISLRGLRLFSLRFAIHVQYTQTDMNRQNTLTTRTIGKRLRFVKDALRFVPLEQMVSSSVDRNSIGEMHLINTCKPCENEWSIGTIGTNGKVVSRLVNHWNHSCRIHKRLRFVKTHSLIVPLVKDYDSYHWNEW